MVVTWRAAIGVLAAVVVAGVVAVVAVAAFTATGDGEPAVSEASSPRVPPAAQTQPGLPVAVASDDPLQTAQQWLQATLAVTAADPFPTAWLDRVAPVVTGPLADQHGEVRRSGPVGAGWEEFVARDCFTTVLDVGGTIPPEAPRTPTTVYVQIAGRQVTSCRGDRPGQPTADDPVAATVELRLDGGVWRVAQRLA